MYEIKYRTKICDFTVSQVSVANPLVDRIGDFQAPPTGCSKALGSVTPLSYSTIDNYIALNCGPTSSTFPQHNAGPKARTEGWAMFREDHVRNLDFVAPSKGTAFVRAPVRASFRVHVRYRVTCVLWVCSEWRSSSHRGNGAKIRVVALQEHSLDSRLGKIDGRCTIAVVGESTAFNDCCTQSCACQASLAPQLPRLEASTAEKAKQQHPLTYLD